MKHCSHCNVDVNTSRKFCPLCYTLLEEKEVNKPYQEYPKYHENSPKNTTFMKITLFILLVACLASIIVNVTLMANNNTLLDISSWWCLLVISSSIYVYTFIQIMFRSRRNFAKRFLRHLFLISGFMICINVVSDKTHLWSLDYLIPIFITSTLLTLIMMVVIKKQLFRDFLVILIWLSILAIIPLILYATTSLINVAWPSIVSTSLGGVTFLGVIILPDKATKEEMKKRFHI